MHIFNELFNYLYYWSDDVLGKAHVFSAVLAIITGVFVLANKKGTLSHRLLGTVYFFSMLFLNISALFKYDLTGSINMFHVAAIFSLMTVIPAYYFVFRFKQTHTSKYIRIHAELMVWSYLGLILALIAETVTRTLPHMLHGEGGWFRFSVFVSLLLAIGVFATFVFLRKSGITRIIEHKTG